MSDGLEQIHERRDELEALAESDLRSAKYAEALLELIDESDADG